VSIAGPIKINTGRIDGFRSFTRERRPRNDVKPRVQIFEPDALSEDPIISRISLPLEELKRITREDISHLRDILYTNLYTRA
jgi:hypothetical protein